MKFKFVKNPIFKRTFTEKKVLKNFYNKFRIPKMLEKNLKFLGFSRDEIAIYLACLKFGSSSAAQISRATKIARVNCYFHIEKLLQKNILTESKLRGVKIFTAQNPRILVNHEIEKLNIAREILPQLLAFSAENPRAPRIQFFEKKAGIKNIFEKMIETRRDEIVSFSNFEKLTNFFAGENFLQNHFENRISQKIKSRFISPRTEGAEDFLREFFPAKFDEKLLEIFLVSPEQFFFESEISIFAGAIAILNFNEKKPLGVLIENEELFRTQKAIFDLAWLGATRFIS